MTKIAHYDTRLTVLSLVNMKTSKQKDLGMHLTDSEGSVQN